MHLPLFIAKRYLFSRKKQNAINIISGISVTGLAVGTCALIVVMSVFNGMDLLLKESTDSFNPDLVISPSSGRFMEEDSSLCAALESNPDIACFNRVLEEKAMARYGSRNTPVVIKGVTPDYSRNTGLEKDIVLGRFSLEHRKGAAAVSGYGVASNLGLKFNSETPIRCYYPDKKAVSRLSALNSVELYPTAVFSSQQEIEGSYILTDIETSRKLFGCRNSLSKLEIKLAAGAEPDRTRKHLEDSFGSAYTVKDKYELNKAFYAMMKSEKMAIFLIMVFILLIASFNIIGSISMLILDKKDDLGTYRALGMERRSIISIFKTEGNLITLTGALAGLGLGVGLCFLQERFGLITLGNGSYIVDAYPVRLVAGDIIIILLTVLTIGYSVSYFPVRFLVNRLVKD